MRKPYNPERLAYWYFRLNGFLTIENFIVHPEEGSNQRTDADIVAVRFSNRLENFQNPMVDDPLIVDCASYVNVIIAEVKSGKCALNGPWTNRELHNINRVLSSIGCVKKNRIEKASKALYEDGIWTDNCCCIRLIAIGSIKNMNLLIPSNQQLSWDEIVAFCIKRFKEYKKQKSSTGQWERDGLNLKKLALEKMPERKIHQLFGLDWNPTFNGGCNDY